MLKKTGAIETLFAAKTAIREIKGLKNIFLRGIFLNYLIFLFITLLLNIFFYFNILLPIINWIFGFGEGLWASLGSLVMWIIQLSFASIMTLISLRFSIEFLSFWNECLVNKVICNFRKINEKNLAFKNFLNEIKYFFVEWLKACFLSILLLIIGLIPVLGLPIIFFLECHYLGKQSTLIYLESLNNPEEVKVLKKKMVFSNYKNRLATFTINFYTNYRMGFVTTYTFLPSNWICLHCRKV